jgi:hypothetical protein
MASEGTQTPQPAASVPEPVAAGQDAAASREQDINPWSVEGGQDESGQVVAIDYINLSKSDSPASHVASQPLLHLLTNILARITGSGTLNLSTTRSSSASSA